MNRIMLIVYIHANKIIIKYSLNSPKYLKHLDVYNKEMINIKNKKLDLNIEYLIKNIPPVDKNKILDKIDIVIVNKNKTINVIKIKQLNSIECEIKIVQKNKKEALRLYFENSTAEEIYIKNYRENYIVVNINNVNKIKNLFLLSKKNTLIFNNFNKNKNVHMNMLVLDGVLYVNSNITKNIQSINKLKIKNTNNYPCKILNNILGNIRVLNLTLENIESNKISCKNVSIIFVNNSKIKTLNIKNTRTIDIYNSNIEKCLCTNEKDKNTTNFFQLFDNKINYLKISNFNRIIIQDNLIKKLTVNGANKINIKNEKKYIKIIEIEKVKNIKIVNDVPNNKDSEYKKARKYNMKYLKLNNIDNIEITVYDYMLYKIFNKNHLNIENVKKFSLTIVSIYEMLDNNDKKILLNSKLFELLLINIVSNKDVLSKINDVKFKFYNLKYNHYFNKNNKKIIENFADILHKYIKNNNEKSLVSFILSNQLDINLKKIIKNKKIFVKTNYKLNDL